MVKNTFIGAGVEDSPHLDSIAWHLIKLYSTTEGWEVVPGTILKSFILYYTK